MSSVAVRTREETPEQTIARCESLEMTVLFSQDGWPPAVIDQLRGTLQLEVNFRLDKPQHVVLPGFQDEARLRAVIGFDRERIVSHIRGVKAAPFIPSFA